MARYLDGMCEDAIAKSGIDVGIPWLLMAAYLYYVCDVSILSDTFYDQLEIRIERDYKSIRHPHKKFVPKDRGLLFKKTEDEYPLMTRHAAHRLARDHGLGHVVNAPVRFDPDREAWAALDRFVPRRRAA